MGKMPAVKPRDQPTPRNLPLIYHPFLLDRTANLSRVNTTHPTKPTNSTNDEQDEQDEQNEQTNELKYVSASHTKPQNLLQNLPKPACFPRSPVFETACGRLGAVIGKGA